MQIVPPRRILLIARDMVGDLVNTTGAVAWVRNSFPSAAVLIECGASGRDFFPDLDVWVRKRGGGVLGKLKRVRAYRAGRFDLAVVLDDSREAARLARLAGVQVVAPHPLSPSPRKQGEGGAWHDLFDVLHEALNEVAKRYGLPEASWEVLQPQLPLPPRAKSTGLILHVTASDLAKEWPEERWIELAKRVECVIAGGPADEAVVRRIAQASGRQALPALPLLEYAGAIQQASVIVTGDTGPAHLAAAVGTRAIVLYGPTDPARFHPWGTNWVALRHPMGCDHYGDGCAFKEGGVCSQKCMRAISVDEVATAVSAAPPSGNG